MTRVDVYRKVLSILSDQLSISVDMIKEESLLAGDLGADSLDTAEIAMMIKDEFGYDISDQELPQLKTVQDLVDLLSRSLTSSQ